MISDAPISSCARADEEAVAWLARLRAPGGTHEQEAFEAWYAADAAHADAYDRVLTTWDRLALAHDTTTAQSRQSFFDRPVSSRTKRLAIGTGAAAAALALLTVGNWPFRRGEVSLIPAAYASVIGEIRTVTLTDGSRVTLDTDTAVQTNYTRAERRLRLVRGRARFKVAADHRPFIVDAGSHSVVAKRTDFDVDLTGDRVAVALFDGRLEVSGAARPSSATAQALAPGETLSFAKNDPDGRIDVNDPAEARWTTGMLSFDDASLGEVIKRANLYAKVKIVLAGENPASLRFTGTFRPTDTDSLARMLAVMFNLKMSRGQSSITLRAPTSASSHK